MILSIKYNIPFVLFVKIKIVCDLNNEQNSLDRYSQGITVVSYSEPFTIIDDTSQMEVPCGHTLEASRNYGHVLHCYHIPSNISSKSVNMFSCMRFLVDSYGMENGKWQEAASVQNKFLREGFFYISTLLVEVIALQCHGKGGEREEGASNWKGRSQIEM